VVACEISSNSREAVKLDPLSDCGFIVLQALNKSGSAKSKNRIDNLGTDTSKIGERFYEYLNCGSSHSVELVRYKVFWVSII
jgi:hypothetical protein